MSFPLYNLPYLALLEVLKEMSLLELLMLQATSKRSRNLVTMVNRQKFHLEINTLDSHKNTYLWLVQGAKRSKLVVKVIENSSTPFAVEPLGTLYLGPKYHIGMIAFIEYLKEALDLKTISVIVSNFYQFELKRVLEHFEDLELLELKIRDGFYPEPIFKFFLDQAKNAKELHISPCCDYDFRRHRLSFLKMTDGRKARIESLLNIKIVELRRLAIDSFGLSMFVKKWWKRRTLGMLEYMEINEVEVDVIGSFLRVAGAEMLERAVMRDGKVHQFQPDQCYRVTRRDGVSAIITYVGDKLTFRVEK